MEFSPTGEQEEICREWREFLQKECPRGYVRHLDATGEFPHALFRKIADRGWLGLPYPTEYGGHGKNLLDTVLVFEELAYRALSVAQAVGLVWLFGGNAILRFGKKEQKDYYIPKMMAGEMRVSFAMTESEAGSDGAALRTLAEWRGDHYVINGSKTFVTGAAHSERMLLVARTDITAPAREAYTCFLVDPRAKGVGLRKLASLGRHSPGTYEVFLDSVEAGPDDVLGEVNEGWRQLQDALESERVSASAMYVGNAQAALEEAVAFACGYIEAGETLSRSQFVRHCLADMQVRVDAARLLTYRAAWQVVNGVPCVKEASMAKLFASEAFVYVTELGLQLLGNHACGEQWDMERYLRDARASTIAGGTSEIQRNLISSFLISERTPERRATYAGH